MAPERASVFFGRNKTPTFQLIHNTVYPAIRMVPTIQPNQVYVRP